MKPISPSEPIIHVIDIKSTERWNVYHRLQELEISCRCSTNKPLQVELKNLSEIIQLCCVVKQSTASRGELVEQLNECWKIESKQRRNKG